MTNEKAPERIWLSPASFTYKTSPAPTYIYSETEREPQDIEYALVDRKYFCSCGAALTADEYISHYFEMGHDRGIGAKDSAAPVVDDSDLISRTAAKAAMCNMCANPDRYKPAEPLEGSMRLFHFQRSDNWNAGQCLAQAIDSVPAAAAAPVEQPKVIHPFGPCGYIYCDWPDGELRCNEPRANPASSRAAASEWLKLTGRVLSAQEFGEGIQQLAAIIERHCFRGAAETDHNNYQQRDDGLYVCYGNHERSDACEWVKAQ